VQSAARARAPRAVAKSSLDRFADLAPPFPLPKRAPTAQPKQQTSIACELEMLLQVRMRARRCSLAPWARAACATRPDTHRGAKGATSLNSREQLNNDPLSRHDSPPITQQPSVAETPKKTFLGVSPPVRCSAVNPLSHQLSSSLAGTRASAALQSMRDALGGGSAPRPPAPSTTAACPLAMPPPPPLPPPRWPAVALASLPEDPPAVLPPPPPQQQQQGVETTPQQQQPESSAPPPAAADAADDALLEARPGNDAPVAAAAADDDDGDDREDDEDEDDDDAPFEFEN
jgi:hypothetical protein